MSEITVIINCYNGEKYLKESLDSIFTQTFSDWEILFWDNNSSDASSLIINKYNEKIKYYKHHETVSLGLARNLAVQMTNSKYLCFLDTDDLWYPNKLKYQYEVMEHNRDVSLMYCGVNEINESGVHIRDSIPNNDTGNLFPKLLKKFDINMVTPILRKSKLLEYNLNFDPQMEVSEEYNLFMQIASKQNIISDNNIIGKYRVSENSLTTKKIERWSIERNITLDNLIESNSDITKKYSKEFKIAKNQSKYYLASYMMSSDNYFEARKTLKDIKNEKIQFFILYLTSYLPFIWKIIHKPKIKRLLTKYLYVS